VSFSGNRLSLISVIRQECGFGRCAARGRHVREVAHPPAVRPRTDRCLAPFAARRRGRPPGHHDRRDLGSGTRPVRGQPANHPRRPGVSALSGLGCEDLLALTRQEAFAGRLRRRSDVFHWARTLDFGPVTLPDAGRLRREGPCSSRRACMSRTWNTGAPVAPRDRPPRRTLRSGDRLRGLLVRAGDWFAHVRDRAEPVTADASLEELVRGAADLGRARALLDFVGGGPPRRRRPHRLRMLHPAAPQPPPAWR
jgi:hypothetical protein